MKFLLALLFQQTQTFEYKIIFLVLIQSFSTMHSKTNLEQLQTNMDKIHSFHDIFLENLQKMSTNNNIFNFKYKLLYCPKPTDSKISQKLIHVYIHWC